MPKWGLSDVQRRSEPWGVPVEWLKPGKTITDPVHDDIYVTRLEQAIVDSEPMQRLRRIRQLGTTHLVYPGATHSRFSHALGALRAAQDLLDAVIDNRTGPRPVQDLFDEWTRAPGRGGTASEFDAELAKVTVLARLGALLHDLNHVSFGHTVEDDLEVFRSHDGNTERLESLWHRLPHDVLQLFEQADPHLRETLHRLIVTKDHDGNNFPVDDLPYPFVADIVGNTICADLIDYLDRDHLYTGLPMALGNRFKEEFYVSPSRQEHFPIGQAHFPRRMVIRVTKEGHERPDVITELLKYLRYRYELSERALAHHAKVAADAMIGKLLEMYGDWLYVNKAGREPEAVAKYGKDIGRLREAMREIGGEQLDAELLEMTRADLEDRFLSHGDDGLLEWLRDWGMEADPTTDGRRAAIGRLATDVLNRNLYKQIGRADEAADIALSDQVFTRYGKRDRRRELEEQAARWAGLDHRWQVVVWLPPPRMKTKVAEVLVDYNGRVNQLDRMYPDRVKHIYDAHRSLWGVSVYADRAVTSTEREILLAYLGDKLGVRFLDASGVAARAVATLVTEALEKELSSLDEAARRAIATQVLQQSVVAHAGEAASFADLVQRGVVAGSVQGA